MNRLVARSFLVLPLAAALAAGCDSSPTEPAPDPGATLTVDASSSTEWAYVDLGRPAQQVTVADGPTSTGWDIAFQVTKVIVNGGENGPGGTLAYCICQNGNPTDESVMAMTLDLEGGDFDAVTSASIPTGDVWSATAFDESRWYRYNLAGGHQIWPTYQVYLVKRGSEVYKVQVISYYGENGENRQITFRYAQLES